MCLNPDTSDASGYTGWPTPTQIRKLLYGKRAVRHVDRLFNNKLRLFLKSPLFINRDSRLCYVLKKLAAFSNANRCVGDGTFRRAPLPPITQGSKRDAAEEHRHPNPQGGVCK